MDLIELKRKLEELGVNPLYYSLDSGLKSDALILYKNYSKWEVFYLDERGSRHEKGIFYTEDEACQYFINEFAKNKKMMNQDYKSKSSKTIKDVDDLPDVINL